MSALSFLVNAAFARGKFLRPVFGVFLAFFFLTSPKSGNYPLSMWLQIIVTECLNVSYEL